MIRPAVTYRVRGHVVRGVVTYVIIRVCESGRRSFVTSYPSELAALKVAGFLARLEQADWRQ